MPLVLSEEKEKNTWWPSTAHAEFLEGNSPEPDCFGGVTPRLHVVAMEEKMSLPGSRTTWTMYVCLLLLNTVLRHCRYLERVT